MVRTLWPCSKLTLSRTECKRESVNHKALPYNSHTFLAPGGKSRIHQHIWGRQPSTVSSFSSRQEPLSYGLPEWGLDTAPGGYLDFHKFAGTQRNLFKNLIPIPGCPQGAPPIVEGGRPNPYDHASLVH